MSFPIIEILKIEGEGILGTSVRFEAIVNIAVPTTVQITIEDSTKLNKVTDVNMTKEADNVFSYIYQSSSDDNTGTYVATIKIVNGGNTILKEYSFTMKDQYDTSD